MYSPTAAELIEARRGDEPISDTAKRLVEERAAQQRRADQGARKQQARDAFLGHDIDASEADFEKAWPVIQDELRRQAAAAAVSGTSPVDPVARLLASKYGNAR